MLNVIFQSTRAIQIHAQYIHSVYEIYTMKYGVLVSVKISLKVSTTMK